MLLTTCFALTRPESAARAVLAWRALCLPTWADADLLVGEGGCSVEMGGEDCDTDACA